MTLLWHIFSSALLFGLTSQAATVSGTVQLANSRDPGVKKKDYSGVVVWLEPLSRDPVVFPSRAPVKMVQKDKRFIPHVLAIPIGTPVEFPNYDPIFHNAFSSFSGQVFDVGLYPPGTSRTVTFKRSGIVRVFCNIHPTMSAVILVLNSDWYAVSQHSGAFRISDVPPGDYQLHVFHERATEATLKALERRVTVDSKGLAIAPIIVSETGFMAAPHKNKYGNDYPPVIEDQTPYPAQQR